MDASELTLTSPAFADGESIPKEYTCDGKDSNPPLVISGVPKDARSLALIMDDPDIPDVVRRSRLIEKFDHWILFNIAPNTAKIAASSDAGGVHGHNTLGEAKYTGPCPPPDHEPTEHRYIFQLYALDAELDLKEGAMEEEVRKAMKGHILAKVELVGRYDRSKK